MEAILKPISRGLSAGTMRATGTAERICNPLKNIISTNYRLISFVRGIPGVSLGSQNSELSAFGPVVTLTQPATLENIYVLACNKNLDELKSDNRTTKQKNNDNKKAIENGIEELKQLKNSTLQI